MCMYIYTYIFTTVIFKITIQNFSFVHLNPAIQTPG